MVNLKCPHCAFEQPVAKNLPVDHVVACKRCDERAEFRQWHEAWCASRRDELIRACPSLATVLRDAAQEHDFAAGARVFHREPTLWY
jgi:hypothetical protein